ncbi:MAG: outer membrane protein assembly factor BamD [Bacteroidetes bacterium]|nr:outer membrane protein assembly factor BamD [Bacteroidota bacterium]
MKIVVSLLLILTVTSCSEYNKVLKSDDYQRKFELAESLYSKKKFDRSIAIYEQIYQRFPKTGEGELSYYRIGKAYYEIEDYYMAGYYLGSFTQRFPFSANAEECLFLSAMCSVKNSPKASLDAADTELAINDLQLFTDRYPNSSLIDSCNQIIDKLRFKLETKEFSAVQLYSKTENYRAAVVSAEAFLEKYPISKFREETYVILLDNSVLLAKNSVDSKKVERISQTSERYSTFVIEFPQSESAKRISNSVKELEKLRNQLELTKSNQ